MPMQCTVCAHLDRAIIDESLASGLASLAGLARDHGLQRDALRRHKERHLPRLLVDLASESEAMRSGQIHHQAQDLYRRALAHLAVVEAGVDIGTDSRGRPVRMVSTDAMTKALRECRGGLDMLARLAMVADRGVQVLDTGKVRSALDEAVERALSAALTRAERGRDQDIEDAVVVHDSHRAALEPATEELHVTSEDVEEKVPQPERHSDT